MAVMPYDLSVVLSGEAGQGLKTLEVVFAKTAKASGFHVFTYTEFMSRIRGGNNTTEIRISSKPCCAFVDRIDVAISLQKGGLRRIAPRISGATTIIGDESAIDEDFRSRDRVHPVPLAGMAKESGGGIFLNTVVLGMLCALLCFDRSLALEILKKNIKRQDNETLSKNERAFGAGYEAGENVRREGGLHCAVPSRARVANDRLLYGSDAVSIGALAGGCNFISSYPMS
ncbi:MAG: 2-oxoacid:acceptor oxidoreductase family protein, partial [Chitinispirillaceae bacterium]|nr:2-oxoacid:acceptor oxidoreductase family protein [Chitinispirillaceae bacterium]